MPLTSARCAPQIRVRPRYQPERIHGHQLVPQIRCTNGVLLRREGTRVIFRDGTVLRLAAGVTAPVGQGLVRAEIDPALHEVRALVLP